MSAVREGAIRIRVLVGFAAYPVGSVFDWDRGMAIELIKQGLIEEFPEERTETAEAAEERGLERADMPDTKVRRRK
jgi:hypothetical protein